MSLTISLFYSIAPLIIVLLTVSPLTVSEILVTRTTVNTNDGDALIWQYLLEKYSSSGTYLTSTDISKILYGLQKCNDDTGSAFHPCKTNSQDPKTAFVSDAKCKGVSVQGDQEFRNVSSLKDLCPKILFFIDNPACCNYHLFPNQKSFKSSSLTVDQVEGHNGAGDGKRKEKPTSGEVWGYGILCVTLISMCSLAGVSVMPFMKKEFYKHLLTALVGLAVGSLTGSAVFHLIPQALRLSDNDPNHEYLFISLMICGGIWMFFMVERILKFIMDYKDRQDKSWKREKMSSIISTTPENNSTISMLVENGNCVKTNGRDHGESRNGSTVMCNFNEPGVVYECQEQAIKASFGHQERPRLSAGHDHSVTFEQGKDSVIATVAWMIIFGDGLHNFIDGLSIGAAFNESILTGVSISVAVLCEELPHELGDFAVLLNAGMSIRQALTYNFLSACTCYIGMAVGIFLGEVEASTYIFALAGGMFLYIALVDMVPEMNEIAEETSKISVRKGLKVLFLQNLGLFIGITALFILAKYQDSIQF